jgi:hypothetical protein
VSFYIHSLRHHGVHHFFLFPNGNRISFFIDIVSSAIGERKADVKFAETVVKTEIAHAEFYAETPDLNKATPSKKGNQPTNDSMIAKKENKQK